MELQQEQGRVAASKHHAAAAGGVPVYMVVQGQKTFMAHGVSSFRGSSVQVVWQVVTCSAGAVCVCLFWLVASMSPVGCLHACSWWHGAEHRPSYGGWSAVPPCTGLMW
jgi:hypothetical protein